MHLMIQIKQIHRITLNLTLIPQSIPNHKIMIFKQNRTQQL
jgi:hypothetical protein